MKSNLKLTPRRTTQLVVWVLAFLFVGVFVHAAQTSMSAPPPSATYFASGEGTLEEQTGGDTSAFIGNVDSIYTNAELEDMKVPLSDDPGADTAIPSDFHNHFLPAMRWGGSMQFQSDPDSGLLSGLNTFDDTIISAISTAMFAYAGTAWTILLGVTSLAFTTDAVDKMGAQIDATAAMLTAQLTTAGMMAAILGLLLLMTAVNLAKNTAGSTQRGIRNLVIGVLVLGFLQVSTGAAAAEKLAPTKLASSGSEIVNDVTTQVMVPLTSRQFAVPENNAKQAGDVPNCEYYKSRLYATYFAIAEQEKKPGDAALMLVSRLWESTMLNAFTEAQYGNEEEGAFAVCHQLESQADTPLKERVEVVKTDGSPFSGMVDDDKIPFGESSDMKHQIAYYFAWMACRNGSGDPSAWKNVDDAGDRLDSEDCSSWWDDGYYFEDGGRFSKDSDEALVFNDGIDDYVGGSDTVEHDVVETFYSGKKRFYISMYSMVSSTLYLYAFGALAIGTIASTFMLAICLMFLPVTLLLLALPTKGGQRNARGISMLKLTGASLMAKFVFYLSISLMVLMINMMNGMFV